MSTSGSSRSSPIIAIYSPKIAEIRETSGTEAADGKTVYIKRQDGDEEYISSVSEFSAYSSELEEFMMQRQHAEDFWEAYNKLARFILSGRIRLSGGRDCFKKLATPQRGVKTLKAGNGVFFRPDNDMSTFGTIYARAQTDKVTKVHLSSPTYDNRGRTVNAIVLERQVYYLIAGDSDDSDPGGYISHIPICELMICHRGRLREAGFEVPGEFDIRDLWLLDSAGTWRAMRPFQTRKTCSGCIQSYANREWPTIDVCEGKGHCDNATSDGVGVQKSRCRPAWAEAEGATSLVHKYVGGRMFLNVKHIRNVAKVLDANVTVRDWDHLSEMTGYSLDVLALLFCSVPSLGERLDKKGASFVPWARESGISLGDYLRIDASALKWLYVVIDGAVIDKHTGLKVKFEEDGMGVIHVEQGSQDFSESLPEGVSGFVRLG